MKKIPYIVTRPYCDPETAVVFAKSKSAAKARANKCYGHVVYATARKMRDSDVFPPRTLEPGDIEAIDFFGGHYHDS